MYSVNGILSVSCADPYLTSQGLSDAQIQLISGRESKKSLEIYQHLSLGAVEQPIRRLSRGSASKDIQRCQSHGPVRVLVPLLEFTFIDPETGAGQMNGTEFLFSAPQQDFADVLALFHHPVGRGSVRQREYMVDDDFHFAALQPRPDVRAQVARDGGFFLDAAWAQG